MTSIAYKITRVLLLTTSKIIDLINKDRAPSSGNSKLEINKDKSFLRWGDGETALALGRSIYFQEHSLSIQYGLIKILLDNKKNNKYELYFPNTVDKKNLAPSMVLTRQLAIVFRPYERNLFALDFREKNLIGTIIKNAPKKSILVGSSNQSFEMLKLQFKNEDKELDFFEIPKNNSWELLKNNTTTFPKGTLFILAAGPGGKIFGHNLIKNGYIVWDIGHGIEFSFGLKGKGWVK